MQHKITKKFQELNGIPQWAFRCSTCKVSSVWYPTVVRRDAAINRHKENIK